MYRLNANSLPAITRKHRRCSVTQKDRINAPIYRYRIPKCRIHVGIIKKKIDRLAYYALSEKEINVKFDHVIYL